MAGLSPATYSVVANTVDEVSTTVAHRPVYLTSAAALGVIVAGFWNFRVVDGFGADVVAANTIGTYQGKGRRIRHARHRIRFHLCDRRRSGGNVRHT